MTVREASGQGASLITVLTARNAQRIESISDRHVDKKKLDMVSIKLRLDLSSFRNYHFMII